MKKIFACICFTVWASLCSTSFAANNTGPEINVINLVPQTSEEPCLSDAECAVCSCLEAHNASKKDTAVSAASVFQISQNSHKVVEVHILPYPYPLSDSPDESAPDEEYDIFLI